jgi:hypothetical protein
MSRPDVRLPREVDHPWHVAINRYDAPYARLDEGRGFSPENDGKHFMYEAKRAADEVPRLALLFAMERRRELPQLVQQCSHSSAEPVVDNHLTCCLGVECRACPHLAALDSVEKCTDEQRDVMKAWTCATHILTRGGDTAGEGYIQTTDDQMYWKNLYESLAGGHP